MAKEEPYDPSNIISLNENRDQKNVTVRLLNCVIPVGLKDESGLGVDTPALLRVRTAFGNSFTELNIVHTATKVPGFWFSSYASLVTFYNDILISMEGFAAILSEIRGIIEDAEDPEALEEFDSYLTEEVENSTFKLPKTKLFVKLQDGIDDDSRNQIKNGIKIYLNSLDILLDTIDIKRQTQQSLNYLTILNTIIAALTSLISFFMLLISLIKNIKDNVWELGIMRSIGLNRFQIYMIYFLETFAVIISALLIGTIVGIIVSVTGVFYYVIFFELPFTFFFPWIEFLSLLTFLILTSVLTTWIGIRGVVYHPIAKILKGLL